MTLPTVVTEALGGSALARRVIDGDAPAWYVPRPSSPDAWRERAEQVQRTFSHDWWRQLSLAFGATGAARERLERVAAAGGVLVTTGQQPGLFGGPVYTWSKAIAALELADAIERATGIPTAPVFWAATDDADFAEARDTWVALPGGAERLSMHGPPLEGLPMHDHPLGDVSREFERLAEAAGSAVEPGVLEAARHAYHPGATVGGAYLTLLRTLLQPMGIGVLDASHAALLEAERPSLANALHHGEAVAEALRARSAEMRTTGHEPQVADVEGLSLVFGRDGGRKSRVPLRLAKAVAARSTLEHLSPNVLLRPVVEAAVLPTVAYVAGPGEIAYFAQVGAVAATLGMRSPLVVPRWSCTIVEPRVSALLDLHGLSRRDLADPHQVESRLARRLAPAEVLSALQAMRDRIDEGTAALAASLSDGAGVLPLSVVEGTRRQMSWRADRLERRLVAGIKRRETGMRRDVATLHGALYPGGLRQERALNLLPTLARHGTGVQDAMRAAARRHAEALVHGRAIPVDET